MSYDRSHIKDYALIQGITLLENVLKSLLIQEEKMEVISNEWIKDTCPVIKNQIKLINNTSADDIASKFLVKKLNKLNDHLLSEFPYLQYALRLSREALHAMQRAYQAHSHIWNQVQLHSILTAMGSSHIVKTKALPFYDYEEKEEEEEKEKKKRHAI